MGANAKLARWNSRIANAIRQVSPSRYPCFQTVLVISGKCRGSAIHGITDNRTYSENFWVVSEAMMPPKARFSGHRIGEVGPLAKTIGSIIAECDQQRIPNIDIAFISWGRIRDNCDGEVLYIIVQSDRDHSGRNNLEPIATMRFRECELAP